MSDHNTPVGITRNLRQHFLYWLYFKVRDEGEEAPKWLQVLSCVLIPSRILLVLRYDNYAPWSDAFRFGEYRFSRSLFTSLGSGPLPGPWFRVVKRHDGIMDLESGMSASDVHITPHV